MTAPLAGFSDMAIQSQSGFRTLMNAMARPATILRAPEPLRAPAPMNPVAAMIALTLCDYDTMIWLDHGLMNGEGLTSFLRFHTGAPLAKSQAEADFAFIANPRKMGDIAAFPLGTDAYPDRSATLVLQVEALTNATGVVLSGPGIKDKTRFGAAPLPENFWPMMRANAARYPRGIDVIFCSMTELAAIPRSTHVGEGA
ncbi:MAG: phosphonate C-P lyase system protein PhnH [Alphaproteobacteria bacterium]|nr:phosphonate C-P lyase system protein PhnH [Alphaproteobacteria bacterium]